MKANTLGATLGYVEPEGPVDKLADTCRGGDRDFWRDTEEVNAITLVYRRADTSWELKVKRSSDTLGDEEA